LGLLGRTDVRKALTLVALAASGAASARAGAQQLENPRTDYTAYTRPQGRMAVGPLKLEHGIIDEIMIGTYPAPWFAFPWLEVPVPNGYLKLRTSWFDPVTIALRGSLMYIDAKAIAELADDSSDASALSTTADVTGSYLVNAQFSVSLGLDWAYIASVGSGNNETTSIEGASTAHTTSGRALGEWRLTRVFALTFLFRYLIYQSPLDSSGTAESENITVEEDLTATSTEQRHISLVPGVSFVWRRWELAGGVGYGVFYLPILGLATTKSWPILDLSFAYRFDLYH